MAQTNWKTGASGAWNVSGNWDNGVPGGSDDASISIAGTYTVDLTDTEIPNNVTLSDPGATLLVDALGQLLPNGTVFLNAGTLDLKGQLGFGTVDANGGIVVADSGTLNGVTWVGPLTLTSVSGANNQLHIKNGITLEAAGGTLPGQLNLSGPLTLYVDDSVPLDNMVITGGSASGGSNYISSSTSNELIFGHHSTVQQTLAASGFGILGSAGALNHGVITLASSSGNFFSNLNTFDNASDGSFSVGAAETADFVNTIFENEGSIGISNSATLNLQSTYATSNAGMITLTNGGTLLAGDATVVGTTITGAGTISLASFSEADVYDVLGSVNFNDNRADTLKIEQRSGVTVFAGAIGGFRGSNKIDLAGVPYASGTTASLYAYVAGAGVLTVLEGTTVVATLNLGPFNYSADTFTLATDGSGGTVITTSEPVSCFATGTAIRTTRGDIPVEAIAVGDDVLTASGAIRPVVWVGHRRIDCARHPRPETVWPIRFEADAFGPAQPSRPLLVSPDHALSVEGALIPARHLVNGSCVTQTPVDQVTYWHVELDAHDVLFADGVPAESFLDTGNRCAFGDEAIVALHADFAARAWEARGCAPLLVSGPVVDAARARLGSAPELRFAHAA